jgi:hypothetical protein
MQQSAAHRHAIVKAHDAVTPSDVASPADLSRVERDATVESYFDLRHDAPPSPSSIPSQSLSMIEHSNAVAPAFAALQYLPVPLIVLSSQKSVILANEAMGRLLNLDLMQSSNESDRGTEAALSVTDILHGYNISQLGIDFLQGGSPILVSWEVSTRESTHKFALLDPILES